MIFNNIYIYAYFLIILSQLRRECAHAREIDPPEARRFSHTDEFNLGRKILTEDASGFCFTCERTPYVCKVSVSLCRLFTKQRVRLSKTVWQAVQKCWFILQYCLWIAGAALIASSSAKVRRAAARAALPPNAFKKGRATTHAEILVKQSKYLSP